MSNFLVIMALEWVFTSSQPSGIFGGKEQPKESWSFHTGRRGDSTRRVSFLFPYCGQFCLYVIFFSQCFFLAEEKIVKSWKNVSVFFLNDNWFKWSVVLFISMLMVSWQVYRLYFTNLFGIDICIIILLIFSIYCIRLGRQIIACWWTT